MNFKLALLTGATGGLGQALTKIIQAQHIPLIRSGRGADCDMAVDLLHPQPLLDLICDRVPDLVINNAGFTLYGDALSHPQEEIFAVNAKATFAITLAAAEALRKKGKPGVILNVSSAASLLPFPGMATYAAAKAFVASFSQSFDAEMKPYGIRILTTLPGQINTLFATRAAGKPYQPTYFSMSAESAARLIWKQILQKKPYQVIDGPTRWLIKLAALLPQELVNKYLFKEINNRIKIN